MVSGINPGMPPILRGRMVSRRPRLPFLPVEILPKCPLLDGVVVPEESTLTEFRDEEIDDVFE